MSLENARKLTALPVSHGNVRYPTCGAGHYAGLIESQALALAFDHSVFFVVVQTKTPPRSITVKVAGLGPRARLDSEVEDGGIVLVYKRTGHFNALVPTV
jgi:hypothetical protein